MINECAGQIHPGAAEGIKLFNTQRFFEAHEELETAWLEETGTIRNIYRGILQIAVVYLHITRANYNGAIKVYERSLKWLKGWPDICMGIHVQQLRQDLEKVIQEVEKLGSENIGKFDTSMFKPIKWNEGGKNVWMCDRCGHEMYESNCKIACPNCGNRFDCSDLNIYFD